ncbi:MAG: DUF3892 domain-containing protein [Planktomarina sp.]
MAKKITVVKENKNGLNTHFNVPGEGTVTRGKLADDIEDGKHPDYHVRKMKDGKRIIASNPDKSGSNNLG